MMDNNLYIFNAYNQMSLVMYPSMIPSPQSMKQTCLPPKFSFCSLYYYYFYNKDTYHKVHPLNKWLNIQYSTEWSFDRES